jgi:hypothetical protein
MTVKEKLLQEIEQLSDDSLPELLDVVLSMKQQQQADNTPAPDRKKSRVKALQGWFEKTTPAPADFDDDQTKWEYLKVKHNL